MVRGVAWSLDDEEAVAAERERLVVRAGNQPCAIDRERLAVQRREVWTCRSDTGDETRRVGEVRQAARVHDE